jgi:hypothetical protein
MRKPWMSLALIVVAAGCNQGPNVDPFDPDAVAELPGWVDAELQGQEDACNTSPFWNDGLTSVATTFFVGSYQFENDDSFAGNEFWLLWPDNDLAATGFEPCQVVWDVTGQREASAGGFDYTLQVAAAIDEGQTTCVEDANGATVYEGDENFTERYDVADINGNVTMFFNGSGNEFASGEATNNSLSWLSDKNCIAL